MKLIFSELQCGKHLPGGQKKYYKNTLKEALKSFSVGSHSWEEAAQNHSNWRVAIYIGAKYHGNIRTMAAERKQQVRKENIDKRLSPSYISSPPTVQEFNTQISLISNLCTHKKDDSSLTQQMNHHWSQ